MKTFDHLNVIGLREWIGLPGLGIDQVMAKIDSGAKTSAMHASNIETFERDGQTWVRFNAHVGSLKKQRKQLCEAPLIEYKTIKSSTVIYRSGMSYARHWYSVTVAGGWISPLPAASPCVIEY